MANQKGVSINSIVKDAVDGWLKEQQSEVPRKHHLVIYSDEESMMRMLKSMDRLAKEGNLFRCFCGPPDSHSTELLSKFKALCRWGLIYLPDLRDGLSNIHRSLVDGGRLAAAVWASPDKVPFLSVVMSTILKETRKSPPPSGIPGPFSLADQSITEAALSEIGFKDIAIERMNVIFTYSSPEDYTHFHQAILAPAHALLADQSKPNISS